MRYPLVRIVVSLSMIVCIALNADALLPNNDQEKVDLIVFSFDRPLQLYCLLESLEEYVTNVNAICIVCRASNVSFKDAYDEVALHFPYAHFIWQATEPKKDFKPLLMNALKASTAEYILFAVDDIIVTDYVDVRTCARALQQTGAYAFYLRLGTNITYSYTLDIPLTLPTFTALHTDCLTFYFDESKSYWAYPNTVDMAVYRKKEVEKIFGTLSFYSPNRLETSWYYKSDFSVQGICFAHSKMVNVPLNIIQQDWHNKNEDELSTQELLDLWNQGYKIDRTPFAQLRPISCHMPIVPTFTKRSR